MASIGNLEDVVREDTIPPGAPIAVINDLTVTFERRGSSVSALRGVSLELRRGEILGLVGESGSGKSVLGLALLGLLPSEPRPVVTGSVRAFGVDMVSAPDRERRRLQKSVIGAVFQDPMTSLNPTMRVGAQVAESCGSMIEARRLLDAVGIPDAGRRLRCFPYELSGGLRQRVMIAMAIGADRQLVIADEPTTALDVTVQAQILDLIRQLRDERGTTFLFVTHDLGVAASVADRIAVLYGGRLAEIGPADEVLAHPLQPYTTALVRSRVTMNVARDLPLPTIAGEPTDPIRLATGCPFGPRCAHHAEVCDVELPPMQTVQVGRQIACARAGEWNRGTPSQTPALEFIPAASGEGSDRPAVSLVDVRKSFRVAGRWGHRQSLQALAGINLTVAPGEAVALVGESGCGKSTLLRVVAGLVEADTGAVDIVARSTPQMVFQDARASLTPWLSVRELISDRLRRSDLSRSERSERVAEVLSVVGLSLEIASAKPAQLSGGQCQRVGLARAIAIPPPVLLCDEPTSALDVSLAATVLNLLGRIRREYGMAMIFVTHDLAAARVIADRVAVMYLGRIVEEGSVEAVTGDPVHPYTKALLAAVPDQGHRSAPARGELPSPINPPAGCVYHPRCPDATDRCAQEEPALVAAGSNRSHACMVAVSVPLPKVRAAAS
jgi:peptide/nickel transport system ATP-binding protein